MCLKIGICYLLAKSLVFGFESIVRLRSQKLQCNPQVTGVT